MIGANATGFGSPLSNQMMNIISTNAPRNRISAKKQ